MAVAVRNVWEQILQLLVALFFSSVSFIMYFHTLRYIHGALLDVVDSSVPAEVLTFLKALY